MTLFTVCSCLRGQVSDSLHGFNFSGNARDAVPTENGWYTLPNSEHSGEDRFGRFHFRAPANDPSYHRELFFGLPIWLVFSPGYFPFLRWVYRRWRWRRQSSIES